MLLNKKKAQISKLYIAIYYIGLNNVTLSDFLITFLYYPATQFVLQQKNYFFAFPTK